MAAFWKCGKSIVSTVLVLWWASSVSGFEIPSPDLHAVAARRVRASSSQRSEDGRYVDSFSGDVCFVQANGDATPDLLVWSGDYADARLVAIDGKTGLGLWATPALPHLADTYLHCVDPATFIVGVSDFSVRAFEAASGRERWRVKVSDKPTRAAVGAGCILVRTDDGQKVGLSVADGSSRSCVTKEEPANYRDRLGTRARQPFTVAGLTITLTTRAQGTPMLTLGGARGKQAVWQTPLDVYSNIPFAMPGTLVNNDRSIFVAGRNTSADISVALIGVDAASGRLLWKTNFTSISFLAINGPGLYAGADGRVRSLDPATGNEIWQATVPAR